MQDVFHEKKKISLFYAYNACMNEDIMNKANSEQPELGRRIAQIRKHVGLSQADLAKKIGVTQQVVAAWERKLAGVHSDNLIKLSLAFGVSTDVLLGIETLQKEVLISNGIRRRLLKRLNQIQELPDKEQKLLLQYADSLIEKERLRELVSKQE